MPFFFTTFFAVRLAWRFTFDLLGARRPAFLRALSFFAVFLAALWPAFFTTLTFLLCEIFLPRARA